MATTIKLETLLAGFALASGKPGEKVPTSTQGIVTSEDGERLVQVLDGISESVLNHLPSVRESQTDHLVIVLHRSGSVDVYANEVKIAAQVIAKCAVNVGETVRLDDIADTRAVVLEGVEIPEDAGVIVLFSARWRKGVFYDFSPLHDIQRRRSGAELQRAITGLWTYLQFQDRVALTQSDWEAFQKSNWFPFVGLPTGLLRKMLSQARANWDIDELLGDIAANISDRLPKLRELFSRASLFDGHRSVFLKALEHFEAKDHMSAVCLLYPRIEGLLRRQHTTTNDGGARISQQVLSASAVTDATGLRHENSLLLPLRFEEYLQEVYFANFDPSAPRGVGRNTVGHGVAPENELNAKSATLGILIAEQIAFLSGGTRRT
tara:strand:+ start:11526 stop:12659 length:1134 start_codon:yes stop_codon:yes gene_type:complete